MTSYKLTYFNYTGMGEPIRFLLSYLNIDFEDNCFEYSEWPKVKPTTPFGKVPVLEIDGKVVTQSVAITRYLAKQAGLVGSDDWESLLIDIAVDNINDLRQALGLVVFSPNTPDKDEKLAVLIKETVPFYMDKFEKIVTESNGYFVNGKLSWADLYFVSAVSSLNFMAKSNILEGRPKLQELNEKVLELPQIKSWMEKRTKCPY